MVRWPWGLCLLGVVALAGAGEQGGWTDMQGHRHADTESARSVEGFSAMLVMTSDPHWREKWDTPPETVVEFKAASEVSLGGSLEILTLIANPKVDPTTGKANVTCDVTLRRPDSSVSIEQKDLPCFQAAPQGDPRNVQLTDVQIAFLAEPGDPPGRWLVAVVVHDRVRGVELPLRTSFQLRMPMPRKRPSAAGAR